jgi:hypothetical protein
MSLVPIHSSCPFDWKGDKNPKLKGGYVLKLTAHLFAYASTDDNGDPLKVVVAFRAHGGTWIDLLTNHPAELAEVLVEIQKFFGHLPFNPYLNQGRVAGETVGFNTKEPRDPRPAGDHPHLNLIRRNDGEPASGMGLELLITEYNVMTMQQRSSSP